MPDILLARRRVPTVLCPQCGTPVEWTAASRWRPFCSERCKMLDLGAWASESYRIPAVDTPESEADAGPGDNSPAERR
jgi:uncharacterized protein